MPPLVSVCIPTYNRAATACEAVRSALAQTYSDLEVVVVDDASDDETCERLRALEDPRVVLYRNAQRLGQVGNRNRTIELANGEFVKFLDSDDALEPGCVSAMCSVMVENPAVGLTFCRRSLVTEDQPTSEVLHWLTVHTNLHTGFGDTLERVSGGPRLLREWLAAGGSGNWIGEPSAVMVRRCVFAGTGGFEPRTPLAPDVGLWVRIMARTGVAFIDEELVRYRVGIGGVSETMAGLRAKGKWLERLWILEELAADPALRSEFPELVELLVTARREAFRTAAKLGRGAGGVKFPISPYLSYLAARGCRTLFGRALAPPAVNMARPPSTCEPGLNLSRHSSSEIPGGYRSG